MINPVSPSMPCDNLYLNAPQCNEVAFLLLGEKHGNREVVVRERDGALRRILEIHRSYDALQYPLMHLNGDDGFHLSPEDGASAMKFYSCRLMFRANNVTLCSAVKTCSSNTWSTCIAK